MNRTKFIVLTTLVLVFTPTISVFAQEEKQMNSALFEKFMSTIDDSVESVIQEHEKEDEVSNFGVQNNRQKSIEELIQDYRMNITKVMYGGKNNPNDMNEQQRIEMSEAIAQGEQKIRDKTAVGSTFVYGNQNGTSLWSNRVGNILFTPESKSYKVIKHGHAAMLSRREGMVIEATTTNGHGAEVFHWSYNYIWPKGHFKQVYEAFPLWIGPQDLGRNWAIDYALNQRGKPYGITTKNWLAGPFIPIADETSWYCSKLIYMAYRWGARYDLTAMTWNDINAIYSRWTVITPLDLYLSPLVGVYKRIHTRDVVTYS